MIDPFDRPIVRPHVTPYSLCIYHMSHPIALAFYQRRLFLDSTSRLTGMCYGITTTRSGRSTAVAIRAVPSLSPRTIRTAPTTTSRMITSSSVRTAGAAQAEHKSSGRVPAMISMATRMISTWSEWAVESQGLPIARASSRSAVRAPMAKQSQAS